MIHLTVRPAAPADVTALRAIEITCFGPAAWGAALIGAAIADPAQDVLLSTSGDAYGVVRVVEKTADLDRIAAMPQARRQGTGRGMLAHLIDHAMRRGANRMLLEVAEDNAAALALYASAGFTQIHRRRQYYPDGTDAVIMELELTERAIEEPR